MSVEYDDFVGMYNNVYPEGYCEHLIEEFERLKFSGAGSNRQTSEGAWAHAKDDHNMFMNCKNHAIAHFRDESSIDIFFNHLQTCYDDYCNRFSILKDHFITCDYMKMQKSNPGQGYHVWHSEKSYRENARVLTYILYLNTLESDAGGETELLYQRKRFRPIQNRLLIFPADFTYTHRGNPVLGNLPKYIVTGWFYYDH